MSNFDTRQTTRNTKTSAWILIQPTLVNGMSLSKDEWRDAMRRQYRLELLDLPRCYDSCGAKSTINHTLACKKSGLVIGHHNEVKAEMGAFSSRHLEATGFATNQK